VKTKLKLLLIILLITLACGKTIPAPDQSDEPVQEKLTTTFTPTATATSTATSTPTATPTFTPEPLICSQLLTPEDGAELPYEGKVIFSWSGLDNATKYILEITMPSGNIVSFESDKTEIARFMEAFEQGGEYQWTSTALNAAGEGICKSVIFTFIKPLLPSNAPQGDGGGTGEEGPGDDPIN
jgi:hypothetical protein